MNSLLLYAPFHLLCGVLTYGITYAYFQREYPRTGDASYREDAGFALTLGLLGPITLIPAFFNSGFAKHGFKFRIRKEGLT